jgi:hypothetical protein
MAGIKSLFSSIRSILMSLTTFANHGHACCTADHACNRRYMLIAKIDASLLPAIPRCRPIRSENRALLVASIARGRRWVNELSTDPKANTESIAGREGCSVRKVNMTISLAFLAPDLVKAAIDGRLPHGMGVARLCDLPAEWSRQRQMLGLKSFNGLTSSRIDRP